MMKISATTRDELVKAIRQRYGTAPKKTQLRILDEFIAVTGYHRQHATRVLRGERTRAPSTRTRLCVYDEALREALVILREARIASVGNVSSRACPC